MDGAFGRYVTAYDIFLIKQKLALWVIFINTFRQENNSQLITMKRNAPSTDAGGPKGENPAAVDVAGSSSSATTTTPSIMYKCSYPNCDCTETQKSTLLEHILAVHGKISQEKQKYLSNEVRRRAEQYVQEVELEDFEDDGIDYCQVRFDDDTSDDQ